ncbi:4-hydroxybenzoate octaprenyltransferase [Brevundimonas sp. 2R-24]|uniref:4-hydroxybenzoate octaprenyltransferase n=1 Tax=Peiella sedimenti TaxID=3061083 RepID=A0ABT8SLC3_9CAUL|nr:4-hydroxybenzoate octaprenyltransferase [Caulobacteraceae bacterium XZ-24]
MSQSPLPDAAPANWVDAYAPEPLKPWLKLGRFDRPIGIWLLLLPGWQGVALAKSYADLPMTARYWWFLFAFLVGAALMRAAGCAYNDIVDRDIDAKVARTAGRPIPSGQLSVAHAWEMVIGFSLLALLVLLSLTKAAILLGVASLLLVAVYPFMKRITWWPQAWLGLTFNWGALMGFAAVLDGLGWPAALLYLGGVFWTLGYDTIYALQDIEDDALVGVKSSARRLGGRAAQGVMIFYVLAVASVVGAGVLAGLHWAFYVGVALYAAHLIWQVRRLRLDDPALALKLFKSNAWAGLILLAALFAGGF